MSGERDLVHHGRKKVGKETIDGPLFSYYVIRGLSGEAKRDQVVGSVTLYELSVYVRQKVRSASSTAYGREQKPDLEGREMHELPLVQSKEVKP